MRAARPADAEAIAAIHNQGIEERRATFETHLKEPGAVSTQIAHWLLCLVYETEDGVVGFAKAGSYDDHAHYYDGIGEATIFIDRAHRGRGIGRALLEALVESARERGLYKLTAKVMAINEGSLRLFEQCGFRRVGTHVRHGQLDGQWLDVVIVERSL